MGDYEAIGDLVTGAALSRAVEPAAGEAAPGHTAETRCLNCGARLTGPYCHECGQRAHVHRTLTAFGQDALSGMLNFEGKIFRTLPLLVWKPGELTRRYIDGQRARFVSPLGLFLFTVFLLFAVIQLVGASPQFGGNGTAVYHTTDEAIAGQAKKIADLKAKRATAKAEDVADIDKDIADEQKGLDALQRFKTGGVPNVVLADNDVDNINSNVPYIKEAITRAKANPQLALFKLQDAASKFAWLLIPISVPFLWLLFPFSRRFKPYDHTVFVTYSLSFMLLLVAVLSLAAGALPAPALAVAGTFVPPIHMYRQLKGTYGLGRFGALWRLAFLLTFAIIAFTLFALAVIMLGISG